MKFTHPLRSPRTRQWEPKSHTDEISSDRKNQTVRSQELHGWDLLRSPRTEFKNPTVNGRIWKSVDVPRSSRKSFTPCSRKNTNVERVCTTGNISPHVPVRRNHSTNDVAFQAGTARQSPRFGSMVMKRVWRIKRKNLAACRIDTQHAETWI